MAQEKKVEHVHVKVGDRVTVISGCEKGKTGNVKEVIKKDGTVLVEGVNLKTKAQRPNPAAGIQGGLVKVERPLEASKVMLVCPVCEKATRTSSTIKADKKVRVCKRCKKEIE